MRVLRSLQNRGFEAVVTTLLFVGVLIAVFLGIHYLNSTVSGMRATASDEFDLQIMGKVARDRLLYCFGEKLENLSQGCEVKGISGYEVRQVSYGVCTDNVLKQDGTLEAFKERLVYHAPAFNPAYNRTCLGKIVIYI